jgi:4-hydroxy-L-threonine phosphate dehydrogenase PdxA
MSETPHNNSITEQMVVGVTMGDAAGIGPEVVVKALADADIRRAAKFIVTPLIRPRLNHSGAGISTKKSAGITRIKWS